MKIYISILILFIVQLSFYKSAYTDELDDSLSSAKIALEKSQFDGVVGLYIDQQYIFWEFGAAREDNVPAQNTQVDINSITKTVTASMVLHMVSTGKLALSTTLGDLFPTFPKDKHPITIHQLLTHTSGLRSSVGSDPEKLKKQDFLKRVARKKLRHPPGETFQYSNVGYSLLAAIIEERSGLPYEDYLKTHINTSSDLVNTGYDSVFNPLKSLRSKRRYDIEKVSWGGHAPYWNLIGNGV